jgi:hypothetical protein
MKRISWILVLLLVAAACGDSAGETAGGGEPADDTPAVMAAAVEQLISVDHTFGEGPPPFTEYLLLDAIDSAAGSGESTDATARPLTESEQSAIEAVVSAFGPLQWIDDAAEYRTEDLRPTVEGGVIIGVGEPILDRDGALVPVSLWCGGLCGTWLTYRVELVDGVWAVTGIEGPIAIS